MGKLNPPHYRYNDKVCGNMIKKYIEYLQYEKKYSDHTVIAYHTDIKQFCAFLKIAPSDFSPSLVTLPTINEWFMDMVSRNISNRTVNRKASTLKSFWRYLQVNGFSETNPTQKLILPNARKPLPVFYKSSVVEAFLKKEEGKKGFVSVRNRLIISLMYQTGIRVSELLHLKDVAVDLSEGEMTVLGKRNKERKIPLGHSLREEIETYLDLRNQKVENCSDALFVRENGLPMYSRAIYKIVNESMRTMTTMHKQSPHVLRHTFATTMLNEGADIYAVKELLGHATLAATQVYTHVSFAELNKIYKQAHPRAKKD